MTEVAERIDARGMNCPLPILKTRKALDRISPGDVLEIMSSDPGTVKDMAVFCAQTGNRLLASNESGNAYVFLIEKA